VPVSKGKFVTSARHLARCLVAFHWELDRKLASGHRRENFIDIDDAVFDKLEGTFKLETIRKETWF
jgi:hypothetical protein